MVRKKTSEPEPEVVEYEKPNCYGTFDGSEPCLKECTMLVPCRLLTGKLKGGEYRSRKPNKSRAIKAFCKSCNGGSVRAGCPDFSCPFYYLLPEPRRLAGPPELWWCNSPISKWDEAERKSRLQKRTIKEDGFLPGIDEEGEEPEENDDDDDQEE